MHLSCLPDPWPQLVDEKVHLVAKDNLRALVFSDGDQPDSGDPIEVLLRVLQILGDRFGVVTVDGRKALNPKVGVLQGDGITVDSLPKILAALDAHGWSRQSVSFGSGGGLLRKVDRDTQRFAFKCSSAVVEGQRRNVYKDPIGGSKTSKAGRHKLVRYHPQHGTRVRGG